jgi:hypothetical protein
MEVKTRNRTELKSYFVKNSIPTEGNFAELIDGMLNQKDDGFVKLPGNPLSIEAAGDAASEKKALNIYQGFGDPNPAWTLSLNPRSDPNVPGTAKLGFSISDGEGNSRLFIDRTTGNVGIGTTKPITILSIRGNGGASDVGITQKQVGGSNSMELTTADGAGNQATRLLFRGAADAANIEFYRGKRGEEKISMFIQGSDGSVGIGTTTLAETDVNGRIKSGALTIGPWPASEGYIFFGTSVLDQKVVGNYALLIDITGDDKGRTFLNSPVDIRFRIGNNDKMMLANNGNVGIGATGPVAKLDIQQANRSGSHPSSVKGLYVTGDFGPDNDGVEFRHSNASQGIGFGYNTIYATGTNADQHLNLMPRGKGNVGIGTTNPGAKLEVVGGGGVTVDLIVNGRLRSNNNDGGLWVASDRFVGGHSTNKIGFWNNNAWRLTVQSDGNVGIGTDNPGAKLEVNGSIKSPLWNITGVFDRKAGPLPVSGTFTSGGGTLIVFVGGTAFRAAAGMLSLIVTIDNDNTRNFMDVYTNEQYSHKSFPSAALTYYGIRAGTHTLKIDVWAGSALTDYNDRFYATVLELPF